MNIVSLQFFAFLLALLAAYYLAGRLLPRYQWCVLLVGSMTFMWFAGGVSSLAYVVLIALVTWGAGLAFDRLEAEGKRRRKEARGRDAKRAVKAAFTRRKRIVLALAFAATLPVLIYHKYWNVLLYYLRVEPDFNNLGILLPLGLSFYLFQSLGYLIDSYNAKYPPERNFLRHLLFVSYFPQVIQGPINRFDHLQPQLTSVHHVDVDGMRRGGLRLGLGLMKKAAIANVLAAGVKAVFVTDVTPEIPGVLVVWGLLVYSIQMYADFSGGIDIVEGASELFGIQMDPNFRQPYFSASLAEFWRRWHMSLGAFMRDYVFYPLAITRPMRRLGKWAGAHLGRHAGRTIPACVANVIVFLLVGVWHGAEAHYVLWGLYNGIVVALADLLAPTFDRMSVALHVDRESAPFRVFAILRTFLVVCVGRLFDCFVHVNEIQWSVRNIVTGAHAAPLDQALVRAGVPYADTLGIPVVTLLVIAAVLAIDLLYERKVDVRDRMLALHPLARAAIVAVLCVITAVSASLDTTNGGGGFLYANF